MMHLDERFHRLPQACDLVDGIKHFCFTDPFLSKYHADLAFSNTYQPIKAFYIYNVRINSQMSDLDTHPF